jgi:hypothetical protein
MRSSFLVSVDVIEFQTTEAYSNLDLTNVKSLLKGYHLDVVGGPSTPHDPESDAGGSLSSWQGHPSR